jgi:uncharacterized phage protein (TIGR01671 family)
MPYNFQEDFEVSIETIGQYTGLKDINGVKIFEGDIVEINDGNPGSPILSNFRIGEVVFRLGVMVIENKKIEAEIPIFQEIATITVIGNIHDNPELLN